MHLRRESPKIGVCGALRAPHTPIFGIPFIELRKSSEIDMAIDFQQVRKQVIEMGIQAPQRAEFLRKTREEADSVLQSVTEDMEALQSKVTAAITANPNLRCAVPKDERLDFHKASPSLPEKITLLAADGSQINPDRHASVDYCLVNVGAIQMQHGDSAAPLTTVQTQLFYDTEMHLAGSRISERMVALMRDLRERELLSELAEGLTTPLITLTDGPLELWVGREAGLEAREYEEKFKEYLRALRRLHHLQAATAGYIDKPRGDLLVRLLEIATLPQDEIDKAGREYRPYLYITDADIFKRHLAPGERSAVFGIQSRSADQYTAELALHFFYLNVGPHARNPYPVRVEIPAWVAEDAQMLDDLHAILVHQCQIMGGRTYPYILHRSHEVAVVTQDEKAQVENMIALELRGRGVEVGVESHKQSSKKDSRQTGRKSG